jgi:hypothetical protein
MSKRHQIDDCNLSIWKLLSGWEEDLTNKTQQLVQSVDLVYNDSKSFYTCTTKLKSDCHCGHETGLKLVLLLHDV